MLAEILKEEGARGVQIVKEAIAPYSATRETENSVRFESTENTLKIFAREFIEAMETGRGPRQSSTDGGFKDNLEQWLKVKGFQQKTSKKGKLYFKIGQSWVTGKSLALKINQEGDKLWRSGGGRDVYSDALDEFTEELMQIVAKDQLDQFSKQVNESLKGID